MHYRIALLGLFLSVSAPLLADIHLNEIQIKGTHNSYHLAPTYLGLSYWRYEMDPLATQLDQGVRQFELDIHWEPDGYFSVYHHPIFDTNSSCHSLAECLGPMKQWSDEHPNHHTLFVFLEPKDGMNHYKIAPRLDALEKSLLKVWPRERILAPDDVRQDYPTLREAVLKNGWPTVRASKQKIAFILLDGAETRTAYLDGNPSLQKRLLFVTAEPDAPSAAIICQDDPIGDYENIGRLVRAGFIVRTRADSDYLTDTPKDFERLKAALDSGAHWISTNHPTQKEWQDYWLNIPSGKPSRCNPINAPLGCMSSAIERGR